MKRKPDTHTAIRRLHDAAQDIVQGFRNASADVYKTPQHNAEVRIPVLMQGTDISKQGPVWSCATPSKTPP